MLMVAGAALPIHAFIHAAYFTMRSGGKTIVTFFFDCVFTWVVSVPLSFVLCRYTQLPVVGVYAAVSFADAIKIAIAVPLLRSGFWAKNIVEDPHAVLPE
jgi:Na+-driven multidrug efflux pump